MTPDIDTLYMLVTEAIIRANTLADLGAPGAATASSDVSILEERIAEVLPPSDPEGAIARRGAVRAAVAAGDLPRAIRLVNQYSDDSNANRELRQELHGLLDLPVTTQSWDAILKSRPAPKRPHTGPSLFAVPRQYIEPYLLLVLSNGPSHGYDMLEELGRVAVSIGPPTLYRHLRHMEQNGLIGSWWEPSQAGPARKTYALTEEGRLLLEEYMGSIIAAARLLGSIVARYMEQQERSEERSSRTEWSK